MRRKFVGFLKGVAIKIVEASTARSKDDRSDKCANATSHVNRATSSQVNGARSPERISGTSRKESIGTPEGVGDNRVAEANQEGGVKKIGNLWMEQERSEELHEKVLRMYQQKERYLPFGSSQQWFPQQWMKGHRQKQTGRTNCAMGYPRLPKRIQCFQ